MLQWQAVRWDRVWRTGTLTPALHLINLKQTTTTDMFNSMLYVDVHAAGVKAHSRNGLLAPVWCARPLLQRLWWSFFPLPYTFWYRPLPVGIKHHRPYKINQFSAHDSPPKWCGCSPRPGAQCGNDPQVKGRLASSSIKEKDCNCTMHRFCVRGRGPAVTSLYIDICGENFHPRMIQNASKAANVACCSYWIFFFQLSVQWYFKYKYSKYSSRALKCNFSLN